MGAAIAAAAAGSRSNKNRRRASGYDFGPGRVGELLHPNGWRVQHLVDNATHGRGDLVARDASSLRQPAFETMQFGSDHLRRLVAQRDDGRRDAGSATRR